MGMTVFPLPTPSTARSMFPNRRIDLVYNEHIVDYIIHEVRPADMRHLFPNHKEESQVSKFFRKIFKGLFAYDNSR